MASRDGRSFVYMAKLALYNGPSDSTSLVEETVGFRHAGGALASTAALIDG